MSRLPSLLLRRRGLSPIDAFMEDAVGSMFRNWQPGFSSEVGATFPIDVKETDKEYEIKADLPGINKENLHLTLEDSTLTIEVQQDREEERKEQNWVVKERFSNLAARSINLPFTSSESKVSAALKDGVLTISVPKTPEKQTKRIAVN